MADLDTSFEAFRPEVVSAAVRGPEFTVLNDRAARLRRRRTQRLTVAVVVVGLLALAVPAGVRWLPVVTGPVAADPASFAAPAQRVADAYRSSGMAFARDYGFVPMQELTVLTVQSSEKPGTFNLEDTFATEAQYRAFLAGRFALARPDPEGAGGTSTVTLPDGTSTEVPTATYYATYLVMHRSDPAPDCQGDDCLVLTITGSAPGRVPIAVEGGTAQVPAWIYTIEGLRAPIARVAVAGGPGGEAMRTVDEVLAQPAGGEWSTRVERIEPVGGDRDTAQTLDLRFTAGTCEEARSAAVYETAFAVIVGVDIKQAPGSCLGVGVDAGLPVRLTRPVGSRIVLTVGGTPIAVR